MKYRYTKEELQQAVESSESIAEVLGRLRVKINGGNYTHLKKRIKEFGLDIGHFRKTGISLDRRKGGCAKKTWQQILVVRDVNSNKESSVRLRRALFESGRLYRCGGLGCLISNTWLGSEIKLHVHHKDGNSFNNLSDNLIFLCPNCHSQTENFGNSLGLTDPFTSSRGDVDRRRRKKILSVSGRKGNQQNRPAQNGMSLGVQISPDGPLNLK